MGASYEYDIVPASDDRDIHQIFQEMALNLTSDYDSVYAKNGVMVVDGKFTWHQADEHCRGENRRWGAAYAYKLKDGRWYIGGWVPN